MIILKEVIPMEEVRDFLIRSPISYENTEFNFIRNQITLN